MSDPESAATTVGNYFVSNYPPFSYWMDEGLDVVDALLERDPDPQVPLGLYIHLPFCRKRCDFCYFKVYTDRGAEEVQRYVDALLVELRAWARHPYLSGRRPSFVYFGGGTPSFLSRDQLSRLFAGLREVLPWDEAQEVAFECEPGTLVGDKLEVIREAGITRLSLGVENFDAGILERNNRAHRTDEIHLAWEQARAAGFDQLNLDLIAGMVGETDRNWAHCVEETLRLAPESVTIYQLEVPYNTTMRERMPADGEEVPEVADWDTKRRWVGEAFGALESAGYHLSSAYTACRDEGVRFLYRDALWQGADMLGIGVSSFSHLGGVHFQNETSLEPYIRGVQDRGRVLARAMSLDAEERLIREFILQLKLGRIETGYFQRKFGVDVQQRFAEPLEAHASQGWVVLEDGAIGVTRAGLLRIDELLHDYFLERHRGSRYV